MKTARAYSSVCSSTDVSDTAALIAAELAATAVAHARVPGRDFELRLTLAADTLRIEVSDARGDREPEPRPPAGDSESGRGLILVEALATSWGTKDRTVGKTVWAEVAREGLTISLQ
ncbi:ATP-binding protein [Streptomyces lunaelactis]|uniref:ATP-binding protein n=1 Tax=Streptomyces lunaelactis TaxID=1535768 RepID=UPI001585A4FB|nr:ATP-binding protein [Streptomyces lunaelactis]NUK05797.1 ATP-binding protein [Streptomyces lunaelactis]NUK20298.1 ATP-binding protein [Streptomyces lunaelactis]